MTAARTAARTTGRAARSTQMRRAARRARSHVQRRAQREEARGRQIQAPHTGSQRQYVQGVDPEGAPESVSIEINAVQADRREERS